MWYGSIANLSTPTTDYRPPVPPTINAIEEAVIALKRAYSNAPILCTKRDINAAFRRIRLRAHSLRLFATEFASVVQNLPFDIAAIYLARPFGWGGSPGVTASIAEIITRYRNVPSPPNVPCAGDFPCKSRLFADDGILIEPQLAVRLTICADTWGKGSFAAML